MKMKRLFVDVETTGIDSRIHTIHQLAGCLEIDGDVVENFDWKIKPYEGCVINPRALEVSHITVEDIMNYPPEDEGYFEFKNMLGRHISVFNKEEKFFIIGYNVKFDTDMLYQMFIRNDDMYFYSLCWGNVIDVMSLASDILADIRHEMPDFTLFTVAKQMGIIVDESKLHDAGYDIEITRALYYKCTEWKLNKIVSKSNLKALDECDDELQAFENKFQLSENPIVFNKYNVKIPAKSIANLFGNKNTNYGELSHPTKDVCDGISEDEFQAALKDVEEYQEDIVKPFDLFSEDRKFILNQIKIQNPLASEFLKKTEVFTPVIPVTDLKTKLEEIKNPQKKMVKINTFDFKINFGKHSNRTIEDIIDIDPGYILWLNDNHIRDIFVSDEIMNLALRAKHKQDNSTPIRFGNNFQQIGNDPDDGDLPF